VPLRNYDRDETIGRWFRLLPVRGVKFHLILRLETTPFVRRPHFQAIPKRADEPQVSISPSAPIIAADPKKEAI
jgi:hypothetical protein